MASNVLTSSSNLSELDNPATARVNLGVYPTSEVFTKDEVLALIASLPAAQAGNKWITGNGVPIMGDGNIDDLYLNLDNMDIYKKTGATTWILIGNLKGSDGIDGVHGNNGLPASPAQNGADGGPGINGMNGLPGLSGGFISSIYLNSSSIPATPTGGTYDGQDEVYPAGGWLGYPTPPDIGETTWLCTTKWAFMGEDWENDTWSDPVPYIKDITSEVETQVAEATDNFFGQLGIDFSLNDASLRTIEMEQLITTANESVNMTFQGETDVFVTAANASLASHNSIITSHTQSINTTIPNSISQVSASATSYTNTSLGYCVIGGSITGHNDSAACSAAGGYWYDGPLSAHVRNLKVTTGSGGQASLSNIGQVYQTIGGALVARGGIVTEVNGYISGFVNHNNGSISSFNILSDVFSVRNSSGTQYIYAEAGVVKFAGQLVAASGTFSGDISGASGTFTGRVDGVNLVGSTSNTMGAITGNSTNASGVGVVANNTGGGTAIVGVGGNFGAQLIANGAGSTGCRAGGVSYAFYAAGGTPSNFAPFTGAHEGVIPKDHTIEIGDLVADTELLYIPSWSDAICYMGISTSANQKSTRGVLISRRDIITEGNSEVPNALDGYLEIESLNNTHDLIVFNAIGEGAMNVCGENGDIEAGDLITSSNMAGKGMKQEDQDNYKPYTVAQARHSISFDYPEQVKQIAVIYRMG